MSPLVALFLSISAAAQPVCPFGMVAVPHSNPNFCVDRYEAMLVDEKGGGDFDYSKVPPEQGVKAVSRAGARPQGYISQIAATNACAAAKKRLCTIAEFVQACQGPAGTTYPYGSTYIPGVCNEHSGLFKKGVALSAADKDPKTRYESTYGKVFPNPDWGDKQMNDPRINRDPTGLMATGGKPDCVSKWGPDASDWIYDMVGNLHEWTSDTAPNGRFKGGYYNEAELNGPGCQYTTTRHAVTHHDYSTGFRCCADKLR